MRKAALFIALLPLLGGCQQWKRLTGDDGPRSEYGMPVNDPIPSVSDVETYLLMGQSNMVGIDAAEFSPHPSITALHFTQGLRGTGYAYGLERAKLGKTVILIQCAVGGSPMSEWDGGDLYDECMERAEGHKITAALFWQGESDSWYPEKVDIWAQRFESMVTNLRKRFTEIPVLYVQITEKPEDVLRERLRVIQAQISLPNVRMASSEGVPQIGDHTSLEGHVMVASRMAQATWW